MITTIINKYSFIVELISDIAQKYMQLDSYCLCFTYMVTILYAFIIVALARRKGVTASGVILMVMLFFYLITVYTSTVIARQVVHQKRIRLQPFISWKSVFFYGVGIKDVIENIIMLAPIGFIGPFICCETNNRYIKIIIGGFLFSLLIESSQYIGNKGFFEVDDLINNTIGVIIGCVIAAILKRILAIMEHEKTY